MQNQKFVVSMLANDKASKTTLFTADGEIIELRHDGPYDINKLSIYLSDKLTGTVAIEIDLSDYLSIKSAFNVEELAKAGIVMTQVINGKSIQGIFYPDVAAVEVTVGEDKVVIPHVENLQAHMARAAKDGSPSVTNFFKRLAPIIQARKHSGEDLMKFIKRSEMPITNDGRIIAYKRVTSSPEQGYVVDTHSKKIKQRVGSRVTMPVDMVDPSRHNSCSTGLHVANLGYLGGFSGDKTLIVLVDPENFIAVPVGEDTKARVSSYDVIGLMSANSHAQTNNGSYIEGDLSFEQLIIAAVEGTTIKPFEEIFVGTKEITSVSLLEAGPKTEALKSEKPTSGTSLKADHAPGHTSPSADVAKKMRELKTGNTLGDDVREAFIMLKNSKSKADVARAFQTSTRSIGRWMEKYNYEAFEIAQEDLEATEEMAPEIIKNLAQPEPSKHVTEMVTAGRTNIEIAREMFNRGDFAKLYEFKKSKKKSWLALGFSAGDMNHIETNKPATLG